MRRLSLTWVLALGNLLLLALVLWQAHLLQARRGVAPPPGPRVAGSSPGVEVASSSSAKGWFRDGSAEIEDSSRMDARASMGSTNLPPMDWRQIEASDYRRYVQNLRRVGCPEQTVRDIVTADLLQAWGAQRSEVMAARYRDFKFWKSDSEEAEARRQAEPQRRALDEQMERGLRELLGNDTAVPSTAQAWKQTELEQQLGFLPEETRAKTVDMLLASSSLDAQVQGLSEARRIPENPDERLRAVDAYEQRRAELAALLSPEEFERVEMTVSWTAINLRRAMEHFEPTEAEFVEIFRAWRAHDENLARIYAAGQQDPGNAAVYAQIRQALTPERYERYVATWWR